MLALALLFAALFLRFVLLEGGRGMGEHRVVEVVEGLLGFLGSKYGYCGWFWSQFFAVERF